MKSWVPPRMWEGGSCFIIGGGPSLPRQFEIPDDVVSGVVSGSLPPSSYSPYMSSIHDKHVIGVNNAYLLGDWIDCLFFGDCSWYLVNRSELIKWRKLKVTCCNRFNGNPRGKIEGIKFIQRNGSKLRGITENPRMISWNSNSGAAAINLAVHFGVKRIILLGFDMKLGDKTRTHWHSGYGNKKPPFERHLKGFPVIAEDAERLGIEILNASDDSAITSFPIVRLKDVI